MHMGPTIRTLDRKGKKARRAGQAGMAHRFKPCDTTLDIHHCRPWSGTYRLHCLHIQYSHTLALDAIPGLLGQRQVNITSQPLNLFFSLPFPYNQSPVSNFGSVILHTNTERIVSRNHLGSHYLDYLQPQREIKPATIYGRY